ncbi:MAG: multicopper oxidase domain-containing protein [Saprospiraceae bacterium]|nr:multicopper oxidase domain-containing protein [Saprospiraceae bacterium]
MNILKFGGMITLVSAFTFMSCHKMGEGNKETARAVIEKSFTFPISTPMVMDATNASFAAKSSIANIGGQSVNTLSYGNGGILGPTLKINQGDVMNLVFTNELSEPTNIHWHGLEAPAVQDGYPTDLTQAGNSYTYNFRVVDRPGTYWYHPHPDMATASQAYRGLAGFFIVTSPEEQALNLPQGIYDVPLVIQDKRLAGGLVYNPDTDDKTIGYFGESVLVNGTSGAVMDVETRTYRFRLLNGSNARMYNFALSDGLKFKLIGSDGGLLDVPADISKILLAPGERADVLINFGSMPVGTELFMESASFSGSSSQGSQSFKIMKFKIIKDVIDNFIVPTTLMPVVKISESSSLASRKFNIGHMMAHGGMDGVMHPIDGKTFDANRRDEVVKSGSVEVWEFDNTAGTEIHPMHLHGLQFQVLKRTGGRGLIQPWEKGWKDTILAFPGEKVKIIIRFPENKGKFVFHCHNLEHEDAGMMLNFEIQ